ncbi:sugar phosphate isomerase/epimerase [Microlunatus sp. Gsoil 973]|uniref:sugar phosphate isomerase/epimerase family protein n=1 Tax=Microlunatus sp. Gsoil 973 TaxID=2672569 RepID=UPI0012B47108|nr:TIM barrel protein [Microlunatus sp. Gsoil 973]QGN32928.1 TIM barrel protein [Microlunatus sp. Gsoil 973]
MTRAVSTWSLHRTLGSYIAEDATPPGSNGLRPTGPVLGTSLLELPGQLAAHGYDTVQICHFHLPHRDSGYLSELRAALDEAGILLDALLVDAGDLTHPTDADAHQAWIDAWIDDAEALGARRARIIAGQQPPSPDRLQDSGRRLARLAAGHPGVRIVTENWMALLPDADSVKAVLGSAGDQVGLLADLGNWTGPGKYKQLAAIAASAETCHAKCHHTADGDLETEDYRRSVQVLLDAGFDGPFALVYDGPTDDEWASLDAEHAIVSALTGGSAADTAL